MDVDGLGEKQVAALQEHGLVRTAGDFYRLRARAAHRARGLRAGRARRSSCARSSASKEQPFGVVLFAVGIEGVGYVTGRSLAAQFRTLDALLAATPEDDRRERPASAPSSPS